MSDENKIVIKDPEGFIKGLRKMLDKWGIPHTCPKCGTEDPKDITLYGMPHIWKCKCGKTFKFKGM